MSDQGKELEGQSPSPGEEGEGPVAKFLEEYGKGDERTPEEIEQTPEEKFNQQFDKLADALNRLKLYSPLKKIQEGGEASREFLLRHFSFPEGMTEKDYESALSIIEGTVVTVEMGLEELEEGKEKLSGEDRQQKMNEVLGIVEGNIGNIAKNIREEVSERKRLKEELERLKKEAEYAKEFGEERFEAGVGEKAKKAEERFELKKIEKEIENKSRLEGHRKGVVGVLKEELKELENKPDLFGAEHEQMVEGKKFTLEVWEEDLGRIREELADLSQRRDELHAEDSKDWSEGLELARQEGYAHGIKQREKSFVLEGVKAVPEKEAVEEKKMGLFDWLRNTKFGRFIKWAVIATVAGPPLGGLGDYLGKKIGLEDPIRKAHEIAGESFVDYQERIGEEYQRIEKEIIEILGGGRAKEAPIEEISSEKSAPIVAEKVPEPAPVTKETLRTEVKEEGLIDKRRLILRDKEVVKKEDQFLDELLGKDFERTARFKEYNARFLWNVLRGGPLPPHSTKEKLEKEYGPEYAALKRMAEELRPELEESARLGKLDQDKIYYLIELHTI